MRSFVKIISSRICEITLSFTDIGKSCRIFNVANYMCFSAIRENKILANITEITVTIC